MDKKKIKVGCLRTDTKCPIDFFSNCVRKDDSTIRSLRVDIILFILQ